MRRFVIAALILIIAVPALQARRVKEKAGAIKDGTFTDKKFGYSLVLNDDWKVKVNDNEDNYRLILTKVKYDIPPDYMDTPDYTKIPRLVVYADTTSMTPEVFIDSLVSETYSSSQKNDILKDFEILSRHIGGSGFTQEDLVPRNKNLVELDGQRGELWTGQIKYKNDVAVSASSLGGKRVNGAYGGAIVAVKNGNTIILFHIMTEWNYFDHELKDAMTIIKSLKWQGGGSK